MNKVISFCIWGNEPRYTVGLLKNIELAKKYYPDWMCWVYTHEPSVSSEYISILYKYSNVKVIMKHGDITMPTRCMLWRLEPACDPDVDILISRDIDTRIQLREVLAVEEWLESGKMLHVMRDHHRHYPKILGGMFGIKCEHNIDWISMIDNFYKRRENTGVIIDDQEFLGEYLYNLYRDDRIIHDEIKKYEGSECLNFPIPYDQDYRFVGCYVYEDDSLHDEITQELKIYLQTYLPHRINKFPFTLEEVLNHTSRMVEDIYIMHYTKLVDRKKFMTKQLTKTCMSKFFNIKWVDNYDRENITQEMIDKGYKYDPNVLSRMMSLPEIANGLAHTSIIESISMKNKVSLILEDDTVFKNNFIYNLYYMLTKLDSDWDMICVGGPAVKDDYFEKALDNCCLMNFEASEIILHKPSTPAPKTMSCILMHPSTATRILPHLKPIKAPIDEAVWQINKLLNVNMYWCQPWLTYEGSKSNIFDMSMNKYFVVSNAKFYSQQELLYISKSSNTILCDIMRNVPNPDYNNYTKLYHRLFSINRYDTMCIFLLNNRYDEQTIQALSEYFTNSVMYYSSVSVDDINEQIQRILNDIPTDVKFDIIIDSGIDFDTSCKTIKLLVQKLNKDGVYIIENIDDDVYDEKLISIERDDWQYVKLPNNYNQRNNNLIIVNPRDKRDSVFKIKQPEFTIITALIDIGRGEWGNRFSRKWEDYLNSMTTVMKIDSPMYIFVEEKTVDFVKSHRSSHNTVIIPVKLESLKFYNKIHDIQDIMNSEGYKKMCISCPDCPEYTIPLYDIIMHNKLEFVKFASSENIFNTEYFIWMDAGYGHGQVNIPANYNWNPINYIKLASQNKLVINTISDRCNETNILKLFQKHHEYISGGMFILNKKCLDKVYPMYMSLLDLCINVVRIIDDDQLFFELLYISDPDLFSLVRIPSWLSIPEVLLNPQSFANDLLQSGSL